VAAVALAASSPDRQGLDDDDATLPRPPRGRRPLPACAGPNRGLKHHRDRLELVSGTIKNLLP